MHRRTVRLHDLMQNNWWGWSERVFTSYPRSGGSHFWIPNNVHGWVIERCSMRARHLNECKVEALDFKLSLSTYRIFDLAKNSFIPSVSINWFLWPTNNTASIYRLYAERCNSTREFACGNGQCISKDAKCDGKPDCFDRSDERNCRKFSMSTHQSHILTLWHVSSYCF